MFAICVRSTARFASRPGPFKSLRRVPLVVVCRVYEAWYLLTR